MARGGVPHAHPTRMSRSRRFALARADAAFVFGTPFDFRVDYGRSGTWNPEAKVVQVDLDGAELGRNRRVDVALHSDSGAVLEALARSLPDGGSRFAGWLSQVRAEEDKKQAQQEVQMASRDNPPNPLYVCAEVGKRLGPSDIVVGDGGDFVATAAYVLKLEWPQVWMDPGPLGTLGVGPGYAMAAKLARPDARVVLMYGDGSFGLHALEFEAMVRQKIPIVAVIGNDAAWTQIRRGQVELYGESRAVATALSYARYDEVVRALGGFGAWVTDTKELGPALDAAFSAGVPACVNVKLGASDFRKGAISV
jgi:acetolactate synthase-1/2/3 large subunit